MRWQRGARCRRSGTPFGLHHAGPNRQCPAGKGIRPALSRVYGEIEQVLRRELAVVSVADVLRETLEAS